MFISGRKCCDFLCVLFYVLSEEDIWGTVHQCSAVGELIQIQGNRAIFVVLVK